MTETPTPTLNLETVLAPSGGPGVIIDGEFYYYADRANWSLKARAEWREWYRRCTELELLQTPTERQSAEYKRLVSKLVQNSVAELPKEVTDKLSIEDKVAVMLDFIARTGDQTATQKVLKGLGISLDNETLAKAVQNRIGDLSSEGSPDTTDSGGTTG